MKFCRRLTINDKEIHIVSDTWVLEENAPGRGILVVKSDQVLSGVVRFSMGWDNTIQQWFTGYVESSIEQDTSHQRLRVRDTSGALDKPFLVSMRNVSPRDLLEAIAEKTHVTWIMGNVPQTKLSHVVNQGTARAAVMRLGRELGIADWTCQAMPDGSIYVGPLADLKLKTITIPSRMLSDVAVTGAALHAEPNLRPGTILIPGNSDPMRVTMLTLTNHTLRIRWRKAV